MKHTYDMVQEVQMARLIDRIMEDNKDVLLEAYATGKPLLFTADGKIECVDIYCAEPAKEVKGE